MLTQRRAAARTRAFLLRTPIPPADNSFCQVLRESVWPDVHQLCGKVGVNRGGFGKKFDLNGPRYFEVLLQCGCRIDQNIGARFHCALVAWPGPEVLRVTTQRTTYCRRGVCRIVDILVRLVRTRCCRDQTTVTRGRIRRPRRM